MPLLRALACLCTLTALLAAQAGGPGPLDPWRLDPALVRLRGLGLGQAELQHEPARATLALELFDGLRVRAEKLRCAETRTGGFTWYGRLDTDPHGYIALAIQDDAAVGVIRTDDQLFRLREARSGELFVYECDPGTFPSCAGGLATPPPAAAGAPRGQATLAPTPQPTDPGSADTVIDIMIVWTQEAEDAVGSAAAMQALIDLAVLETNVAYDQSEAPIELRLVFSAWVDYVETGSMFDHVSRLRDETDGFMDEVHGWRDTYGADAVSLFLADSSACGVSYNNGFPPVALTDTLAFSGISQGCATGVYAFAHELGHNFGLDHDRPNTTKTPSHPFAHGFNTVGGMYRTIMALPSGRTPRARVPYFSNPDVSFNGLPLGVPALTADGADCALALELNAPAIAAFRATTVPAPRPVVSRPRTEKAPTHGNHRR